MKPRLLAKAAIARLKYSLGKNTPLRVLHRITTRCNLQCSFCDHQMHKMERDELTTLELKDCMSQFASLGTVAWGITGGEVFLRNDLIEILRHSKKLGFLTSMITNGTVGSDLQIVESARSLDFLVTSLDGDKDGTDKIRGSGVFEKVIHTIEAAKSGGVPVIVGTVLTRELLENDGIRTMGRLAKEVGFRVSFQNLLLTGPYGGAGFHDAKANILPHEPCRELLFDGLDQIMAMRAQGYPFVNNQPWVDYLKDFLNGNKMLGTCYAGKLYCNFFEDGSLRTCQYHPVKIKENSIEKSFRNLPGVFDQCPCLAICYINYNLAFDMNIKMVLDGIMNAFK